MQLSTHWCAYNVDNSIKPRLKAILSASIFLPEAVASPVPWISFISEFSITIHSLEWRSFQNVICLTLSILKKNFPLILLFLWDSLAAPFWYLRIIASGHLFLCRVSERETALEETHRLLQQFPLDLEKFLAWLTEAETTANVLQDATHKERLLEDSKGVRELMKQWQVSQAFLLL